MKKLLSVVLSLVMILGMVMPMGVMAEETTKLTQAERFELINNPYTSFDMNFFQDFFATDEDFAAPGWDQSSTAASSNILAYKGFAYSNYANRYPNNYAGKTDGPVTAFKTSAIVGSTGIEPEADGSYTYTIGSVPFELGTIAETGKMGANGFLIRARYQPSLYADSTNPINAVPSNYLNEKGKAVGDTDTITQAVYTLNQSGLKSAELLMYPMYINSPTYHTVYVTYEGESTPVKYFAVSGYGTKNLKDNIFLVPKNTYDNLTGETTMKLPTDYTLDEFKALVEDDSLTALPANWKSYQTAYNKYLETTKYYKLNGDDKNYQNTSTSNSAGVVLLKTKETAVDLSKLSANCTETKILLPSETQKFVPARRYSANASSSKDTAYNTTYTYRISVPLDPNKKVSTIKIAGELRSPADFVEESGGVSKVAKDSGIYYGKLMLKYDGNNIYTDSEGNQYYIFCDITRECGTGAILGMTLVDNETLYNRYVELNEELKAVDSAVATVEDCAAYRATVAELIAEADGNLIESDFDLSKIEAAEERLEADEIEAKAEEIVNAQVKTNFPISEANGANSTLFMADGAKGDVVDTNTTNDLTDYVFGLDYNGTITYDTTNKQYLYTGTSSDFENKSSTNFGAFIYTIDKGSDNSSYSIVDLVTKNGTLNWTINDVDYQVDPLEKVIKVYSNVKTADTLTDEELKARFNSLNGVTLDVVDGYYKNVGILAGSGTTTRNVKLQLVYKDGSTGTVESLSTGTDGLTKENRYGFIYAQLINAKTGENRNANGSIGFKPITITAEPTKELDKIIITPTSVYNPVFVISAWGNSESFADALAKLGEIEVVDAESCAKAKAAIADFDALLARRGYTLKDLGSYKAPYTNLQAEIAEYEADADRLNKLNERTYTYLEFAKDRDLFASYHDIADLAKFQKSASGGTKATAFNTLTYNHNGTTIWEWLPHVRADGETAVTGQEVYYFKGFANASSATEYESGKATVASYVYIADDLIKENGTPLNEKRVNSKSSGTTSDTDSSKVFYDGTLYRTEANRTVKNPTFVQTMDENGYVIIKNGETQHKIGPVAADEIKPNAMRLSNDATPFDVDNAKGSSLDILITSSGVNTSSGYRTGNPDATKGQTGKLATGDNPLAALQQVVVTYADGTVDSKKMLVVHNASSSASDTAYRSIVFAPKYDASGEEIVYDEDSFFLDSASHSFTRVTSKNLSTIGLSSVSQINTETVKFESPSIIYSTTGQIAQMVNNRQDALGSNYGNYTSYASIPLKDKAVVRIDPRLNLNAAVEDPTAIAVSTDPSVLDEYGNPYSPTIALLPLTIEDASEDYVYFAYVSRVANASYLMGATIMDTSAQEKIDAAEEAMAAITLDSAIEDAKAAYKLYEVALGNEYVKEEDFDTAIVTTFMQVYETLKINANVSGKMAITFYEGQAPIADITINNPAELEGKPYKVILAYYDENDNYISSKIHDGKSTTAEKTSFTIVDEECPENVAKVKGFIWKGFDTLIPLADAADSEAKTSLKILSIGNSYSQDAQSYLYQIAKNAGFETIEISNAYIGGCTLATHLSNSQSGARKYTFETKVGHEDGSVTTSGVKESTLLECLKANEWDIITLQQQSYNSSDSTTFDALEGLIKFVQENKTNPHAKLVWHMTWGYAESYAEKHSDFKKFFGGDTQKMYEAIVNTVKEKILTNEDIAFVIPSGTAIQNARLLELDNSQLSKDGTHLNEIGDYVAGLTWFAKITGRSIDDITFTPNEEPVIAENLDAIKTAVKNAINNPYQVTE